MMRNEDEALDLSQDAWVKGWQRLAQFQGDSSFVTWMTSIVINLCLDQLRKHKRQRTESIEALEENAGGIERQMPVVTPNPTEGLERAELRARIDRALSQLSAEHRAVLVLHEFEEWDCDVAVVLRAAADGVAAGWIETREFRMKHEMELKIQAWLDGETSDRESARISDWVARDSEAGALAAELRLATASMTGNESNVTLPEAREFYWSKIERQIQREAASASPSRTGVPWFARWRSVLLPTAGGLAFAIVMLVALEQMKQPGFDEISATDSGMDAVTFHDQSAQMTVVWLQDNSQTADASQQPMEKPATDEASSDTDME
jgi:RNA polymerase sigma-70 factor (ECF subfamily)